MVLFQYYLTLILPILHVARADLIDDAKKKAEEAKHKVEETANKATDSAEKLADEWVKDYNTAVEQANKKISRTVRGPDRTSCYLRGSCPENSKEKNPRFFTYAIIKPYLFLGGYFSLNSTNIEQHGITANLNAGYPLGKRKVIDKFSLEYKEVPVNDFPTENIGQYFKEVTDWMEAERHKHGGRGRIWVNCMEGVSRSASCVLAYLLRFDERKWTLDQYMAHIIKDHRAIRVNPGFKKQLADWEKTCRLKEERHAALQNPGKIAARPVAPKNMDAKDIGNNA